MTDRLEMPIEQFAEAVAKENGRLNKKIEQLEAALRVIVKARENKPDNCSDEYLVWCCVDTARAALVGEKKDGQEV